MATSSGPTSTLGFSDVVDRLIPIFAKLLVTLGRADPVRMSFAGIGNRLEFEIGRLLRDASFGNEAAGDMLGMSKDGFRKFMQRFGQSCRGGYDPAPSWTLRIFETVCDWPSPGPRLDELQGAMLERYHSERTDGRRQGTASFEAKIAALLANLVRMGALKGDGQRPDVRHYRQADPPSGQSVSEAALRVALYRSERPLTKAEIEELLGWSSRDVRRTLDALRQIGALVEAVVDDQPTYKAEHYHLPYGTSDTYAVCLLDHIHAVVDAICDKVASRHLTADLSDSTGGVTYTFVLPVGERFTGQVEGFLQSLRRQLPEWLAEADNRFGRRDPSRAHKEITIYGGQRVTELPAEETTRADEREE